MCLGKWVVPFASVQSCFLVCQGLCTKEKTFWSTATVGNMSSLHLLIRLPSRRVRQDNGGTLRTSSAVHGCQTWMDSALPSSDVAKVTGQAGTPGRIAWLQLTHHLTGFYRNQLLWAGTLMNLQRTGQKTLFLGTTWPPTVGGDSPLLAHWDHLPLLCLPTGGTGCRLQVSLELHWGLSQCWWKSECLCVHSPWSCTRRKRSKSVLGGSLHMQTCSCQTWHVWVLPWGPHGQVNPNHKKLHGVSLQVSSTPLKFHVYYCFGLMDLTNHI